MSIEKLIEDLHSSSFETREAASGELARLLLDDRLFVSTLVEVKILRAEDDMVTLLRATGAASREAGIRALAGIGAYGRADEIACLLTDPVPEVRIRAVEAMEALVAIDHLPRIHPLLKDREAAVRRAAVRVIGRIGENADVAALSRLIEDADEKVRERAIETLVERGVTETAAEILPKLEDEDPGVQWIALYAVRRFNSREALPAVLRLLRSPHAGVREQAASVASEWEVKEAIPDIREMLHEKETRWRALDALDHLGDRESTPDFVRFLGDSDRQVRGRAIEVLGRLRVSEAASIVARLLDEKESALALARMGGPVALAALRARPGTPSAEALARLGINERVAEILGSECRMFGLNALRSPVLWKRLSQASLPATLNGSVGDVLDGWARESRVALEIPESIASGWQMRLHSRRGTLCLLDALEEVLVGVHCEALFEDEKVRVVFWDEARNSFTEWWKQR